MSPWHKLECVPVNLCYRISGPPYTNPCFVSHMSAVYEGCICVQCMQVSVKMSVHVRSPGNFKSLFTASLFIALRCGLLWNQELMSLAILSEKQDIYIYLPLPLSTLLQRKTCPAFCVGAGIWIQMLVLAQGVLLSTESSPQLSTRFFLEEPRLSLLIFARSHL